MATYFTFLARNSYDTLSDTGAIRDPENLFVTRTRRILFRGTESQLIAAFRSTAASPSGGSRMLCAGLLSADFCEGTSADPHYEAEVKWIGLHSAYRDSTDAAMADATFQYRILCSWTHNQTQLPIESKNIAGDPYFTYADGDYVTDEINAATGAYTRCNLFTFVPSLEVIGVIDSGSVFPVSPATPKIQALITLLNTTHAPPSSLIQNWDNLQDPMHHFCKYYLPKSKQSGTQGAYIPTGITSHRHLSFGTVHAFTMQLQWQQGKTP